ncbi:membrane protein [Alkalihalobacillus alcalophilus ATCC 27647 = CGMCC 1.3604]|uniref:Membrane protein n=1 Tax=Alkalihalobacillus alcalophilus ATCC 27647 = CGMCC 1.3604 TaxID=1218173 RepID=A0A094WME7_ALKAL|nr:putative sulfate exporter family transporter [Alkalihalobacillus alcalophilus]KGA98924.1 membrane protein [Alkalihalobacillus alcalophilus ATCC 27647 = CGMCC 1.3604]MED1561956.1 putative sulfate exporter family transporter [Alkalihalobacillus alcalophilus]THG88454.1 membrane protein [Alkalihalobacillus alcalophilus ATCC 27647 = CGMCC 1.3604]
MKKYQQLQDRSFYIGMLITLIIAVASALLAQIPYLTIIGQLVLAMILGTIWNHTLKVKNEWRTGIEFSSKKLLRLGIILLGLRLDITDIYFAGWSTFLYALILLVTTLGVVYWLARLLKVDKTLSLLTACGTAICGASAIVAIVPLVKAKQSITAVSIAVIAILGTIFTLLFTFLFPMLPLSAYQFGLFTGGTLHEIAHTIAASSAGGTESEDIALVVKLTRVALLVPVAILIGFYINRNAKYSDKSVHGFTTQTLPIPWFIVGFLTMSTINSVGILPEPLINVLITISYLLLGMAMAGVGFNVDLAVFKKLGLNVFYAGLLGTIVLVGLGFSLICLLNL